MNKEDLKFISEGIDRVYAFISDRRNLCKAARDYSNGAEMNMAEINTLSLIADNPGICVSGVSKILNRTLSAASQNINKLFNKNLIEKRKEEGNRKTIHLYATQSGQKLSDMHKEYDKKEFVKITENLLEFYTVDELKIALKVFETGIRLVEENKL